MCNFFFGLMAFTTFVYDTLDVCTRLGRYIVTELLNLKGIKGKIISTIAIGGIPLVLMSINLTDPDGNPVAIWSLFWKTFGSSNQLLAALALIGITVWLQRTAKNKNAYLITLIPAIFMFIMSTWALISTFLSYTLGENGFIIPEGTNIIVPLLSLIYIILAIWVAIECASSIIKNGKARSEGMTSAPNLT